MPRLAGQRSLPAGEHARLSGDPSHRQRALHDPQRQAVELPLRGVPDSLALELHRAATEHCGAAEGGVAMRAAARVVFVMVLGCFVLVLPVGGGMPHAFAVPGTLLRTVIFTLPGGAATASQCPAAAEGEGSGIGTSVTLVPGRLVGLPQPVLLVTSCFVEIANDPAGSKLYFVDPANGSVAKTITITPAVGTVLPPNGFGSMAFRGDKGDILGCGNDLNGTHALYSIDISVFNTIADGTATFLFNAQPGLDICDGVAWDSVDKKVYQSPDV